MWLLSLWMLLVLGLLVAGTSAQKNDTTGCSTKICRDPEDGRLMCGSDGVTYPSRCHLDKAKCKNSELVLIQKGACREQRPCLWYAKAQPHKGYRPQCRPDGTYAPSQCHPDSGYCWCVTPQGMPIPHTSIKLSPTSKPHCNIKKKVTKRKSPGKNNKRQKRPCKRADRALFNNNLIKIFVTEYVRENGIGLPNNLDADKTVLEWEFKRLDRNKDGALDKNEHRDLRKIVRNAVKPKRCAQSFGRTCDMDRNQHISAQEWFNCLSRDGMDDVRGESASSYEEEEDEGEELFAAPRRSPPHGVLFGDGRPATSMQKYDDDSLDRRDEDTDCLSDRQLALGEQRADKLYQLYIPECTPDGRYQKIQCYKSAGYCWCVNEDTGKNIPGTSVKNQTPKCDQIPSPSRPMQGCPEEKKTAFLKNLMDYLHQRMMKETNGTSITGSGATAWKASKEEQLATWSFVVFDKNKNKVLDRSEWKTFKDLMMGIKNLRRCGKKLPRYCDINKDRQISMTEWLDCLNTQRHMSTPPHVSTTVLPGLTRTGKNPLSMLLDD